MVWVCVRGWDEGYVRTHVSGQCGKSEVGYVKGEGMKDVCVRGWVRSGEEWEVSVCKV